jgi:hypothetical protein
MGNRLVRAHGWHSFPALPAEVILDAEVLFIQASEREGSKVHVPKSVVACFKPDVFLGKDVADSAPVGGPSDPAVLADESDLDVGRAEIRAQWRDSSEIALGVTRAGERRPCDLPTSMCRPLLGVSSVSSPSRLPPPGRRAN